MKLKMKIFQIFNSQKELFKKNKKGYILDAIIYLLSFLFFFSLPTFSYNRFHQLPILLMAILCIFIGIKMIVFEEFFIDEIILSTIGFLFCNIVSFLANLKNGNQTLNRTVFILPLMFFVFYHFFINKKNRNICLQLFGIGMILFSLCFIFQYYKMIFAADFERLGEKFGNQNTVGSFFSLAIAIYFNYFLFQKKKWVIPWIACFIFLGFTTGSKSFLVTSMFAVFFQTIIYFGKKKWYISFSLIVGVFLLAFLLIQFPMFSTFKTRIYDFIKFLFTKNKSVDPSSTIRFNMVVEGMELFFKKPIFGWGTDGFRYYSSYGTYAHNTIVDILVNYGLIAFILFEIPFIRALFLFKRAKEENVPAYLSMLVIIFVGLFTSVYYSAKIYYIMLSFVCAAYHEASNPKKYVEISFCKFKKEKENLNETQ